MSATAVQKYIEALKKALLANGYRFGQSGHPMSMDDEETPVITSPPVVIPPEWWVRKPPMTIRDFHRFMDLVPEFTGWTITGDRKDGYYFKATLKGRKVAVMANSLEDMIGAVKREATL